MTDGSDIRSLTGATMGGAPLALARAPAEDLKPWISWIGVTEVQLPPGQMIECRILNDQPCLRLLYGANWTAHDREGQKQFRPGKEGTTAYFGAQSRVMPVSVDGSFLIISLYLTTGSWVLGGPTPQELIDRVIDYDRLVGHGRLTAKVPLTSSHEQIADTIEAEFRRFVDRFALYPPCSLSTAFERACLAEPEFSLEHFARRHGVSLRTLERVVKREFGIPPRLVRSRARALDIAASLLGVALPEEEATMGLRYYDQAHQIREIRRFFGITPRDLVRGQSPLLRITLELRQQRRLAVLRQLARHEGLPWRDPAAEPARTDARP